MLNMVVMIVPGPTRSGMAIGTAPILSRDSTFPCVLPENKILITIIIRRIPPATSKL